MSWFTLLLVLPQLIAAAVDQTLQPSAAGEDVVCIIHIHIWQYKVQNSNEAVYSGS